MASAVSASILHQDPRYYQVGHGGYWRRGEHGGDFYVYLTPAERAGLWKNDERVGFEDRVGCGYLYD